MKNRVPDNTRTSVTKLYHSTSNLGCTIVSEATLLRRLSSIVERHITYTRLIQEILASVQTVERQPVLPAF